MLKIYHNSRCKKSRSGLEYLKNKNIDFEIVEYLKAPLSVEQLTALIDKTGLKPFDMIRTQEDFYKKEMKGKEFSDEDLVNLMVENPKLIKRPIVESNTQAVWADPVENIDELSL